MEDSSSNEESEEESLNTRMTKYANIKSKPIGNFTDSDSNSNSDNDSAENEHKSEQSSHHSNDSDDDSIDSIESEPETQTENFNVAIRVRPLFSKEKMLNYKNVIKVTEHKYVTLKNPDTSHKKDYVSKRDRQKRFQFDNVFDKDIQTEIVYKKTVRRLIKPILEGYNATVFAYGATGSGKTYTMLGSDDGNEPGIMIHTLRDLFAQKQRQSEQYSFRIVISFLEIYNENIHDLLVKKSSKKHSQKNKIKIRETIKGIIIAGITFKHTENVSQVMQCLNNGNKRRTTESTAANKASSRSHGILQIYVERKAKDLVNDRDIRCGKLNLIDLAGSEKGTVVKKGNQRGMREGANINKSLLALSKCINALVDKRKFIPYRDSKLTRLLQDALGGNCKTVMICNISPSSNTWDDTHNTLKYADRAKNIRIKKAEINKMKNNNKNDLNQVISTLQREINALKTQLTVKNVKKSKKKRPSSQLSDKDLQLLTMVREKLQNKMLNLENIFTKQKHLIMEETNLLSQEMAMKSLLTKDEMNSHKYRDVTHKIGSIKLQKIEIENEIDFIVSNTEIEIKTLVKQYSNNMHLHTMIQRENQLFLAEINKKRTELNMSAIKKKNDILLEQNMEFERIRVQLNELKDATNKQKTQQKSERSELEKQLTFYKDKFEKLEQEKVEQKTTKNEDLPLRKQNLKPLDIPVSKWDKSDLYFWLTEEICIEETFAMCIYTQGFDGDSFADISENDLKEIGINAMGVRKKIMKNVHLICNTHNNSVSQSTIATSVNWNSVYKGGNDAMMHSNEHSLDGLTSVSQRNVKPNNGSNNRINLQNSDGILHEIEEEKSKSPLMDTSNGEMDESVLKQTEKEAKTAVNKLAHKIKESITVLPVISTEILSDNEMSNESEEKECMSDRDNNEFEYDETWMHNSDDRKSFNLVLLSPLKALRKAFLSLYLSNERMTAAHRKQTLSYNRYETEMKCGSDTFVFRIIECSESNCIPDLFDNALIQCILLIFPMFTDASEKRESEFMQDLDTWLPSSGHWQSFWDKSIRLLDRSLSFEKNHFRSVSEYFECNAQRQSQLNQLFSKFNAANTDKKWINIDTNAKAKLKIKENGTKFKFKWPNIPSFAVNDSYNFEDWTYVWNEKMFDFLSEPNKSYFLISVLLSPKKGLLSLIFEETAQSALSNGALIGAIPRVTETMPTHPTLPTLPNIDKITETETEMESQTNEIETIETNDANEIIEAEKHSKNDTMLELADIENDENILSEIEPMKSAKESIELEQTETETIVMTDTENIAILEENSLEYNGEYAIETENKYEIETENINYEIEQNKFENQNNISIFDENNENIIENGNGNDGDVTPPISDDFIVSPSPFIGATNESSDGSAKPIINGNGKRVSKAYHGYQPSWANTKANKLQNQWNYYQNHSNNGFHSFHQNRNSLYSNNADSDDEDIDNELDINQWKTNSENKQQKTFSDKYVSANRSQSIMRYKDILEQSTKAMNEDIIQDFSPSFLEIDDSDIIQQRRGSKYASFQSSAQKYKNESANSAHNYSAVIEKAQSVSSNHSSYVGKREFGANVNTNRKKGNMLKRMFAWTK